MSTDKPKSIGVLALQGAFIEHINMLKALGVDCYEIRNLSELTSRKFDGLVLPGGESTTQGKLLHRLNMFTPLQTMIKSGTPVLATCAGAILLAQSIANESVTHLKTLPATIKRNAYGRQLGSFTTIADCGNIKDFPMTFIRAPYFESSLDSGVHIIATVNDKAVAIKYKNQLALSFHPEVTTDNRIHKYFLSMIDECI